MLSVLGTLGSSSGSGALIGIDQDEDVAEV